MPDTGKDHAQHKNLNRVRIGKAELAQSFLTKTEQAQGPALFVGISLENSVDAHRCCRLAMRPGGQFHLCVKLVHLHPHLLHPAHLQRPLHSINVMRFRTLW